MGLALYCKGTFQVAADLLQAGLVLNFTVCWQMDLAALSVQPHPPFFCFTVCGTT